VDEAVADDGRLREGAESGTAAGIVHIFGMIEEIGSEEIDHAGGAAMVVTQIEDDGIGAVEGAHGGNGGGAAEGGVGEDIQFEIADVAVEDFYFFECAVVAEEKVAIVRQIFRREFARPIGNGSRAVCDLEVHVLADFAHLRSEEISEGVTVGGGAVVSFACMREQRARHLLGERGIDVMQAEVGDYGVQDTLAVGIEFWVVDRRNHAGSGSDCEWRRLKIGGGGTLERRGRHQQLIMRSDGWSGVRGMVRQTLKLGAGGGEIQMAEISGVAEEHGEEAESCECQGAAGEESAGAEASVFEDEEKRRAVRVMCGGSGDENRLRAAIFARERDDEIEEKIEPQAGSGDEAGFVSQAIAKKLESVFAMGAAKVRWIEAKQAGVYLLRHNPPLRFFWRERHGEDRRGGRLRSGRACARWR